MDEEHWLLVEIDIDDHSGVTAFGAWCDDRALALDSKLIIVLSVNYLLTLSGTAFC